MTSRSPHSLTPSQIRVKAFLASQTLAALLRLRETRIELQRLTGEPVTMRDAAEFLDGADDQWCEVTPCRPRHGV